MAVSAILAAVFPILDKALERILPDEAKRDELRSQLARELLSSEDELTRAKAEIIKAEAGSAHQLAAIWRPILMLTIIGCIANNYLLAPYLYAITGASVIIDFPPEFWHLMTLGVGGYIGGRSVEKVVGMWRDPDAR